MTDYQQRIDALAAKGDTISDHDRIVLGKLRIAQRDDKQREQNDQRYREQLLKPTETLPRQR